MKAVFVALLFAVCALAFPSHHQLDKYTFDQFVRQAGRPYKRGTEEYLKREKVFNDRLESIKAHNADNTKTWKRGINQFADMTAAEFKEYNRAIPTFKTHNLKDYKFKAPQTFKFDLPRFVDYRMHTNPSIVTAVKNQGSCGSCWAHSAAESVESYFALKYGQLPVLSPQQIASCDMYMSGCGGGSYGSGWDYIRQSEGLNEEFVYPYVDFFAPQMSWNNTQKCQNISERFPNIPGVGTFTWWPKANATSTNHVMPNDAHALMEALHLVGPQSISVAANHDWSDYESGVLQNNYTDMRSNFSWQEINHAVQAVGYGYDYDLNMNYWIVRNSWGTNYGEQGYIRLDRPEVEPCGNLTGSMICGTSGILCDPAYPTVANLELENGYYF